MSRQPLGQHFLQDKEILRQISEYFSPPADFGEIGPGHGELTKFLIGRFPRPFWVFEKDDEFIALHKASTAYKTIAGDFLDWDFTLDGKPVENFSLVGNLPYESGTMILRRLVERADQVSHFVFLLQKEVVERISARPRTSACGSLTVYVQGRFEIEPLRRVPPSSFKPPPKVDSQVLRGKIRAHSPHPQDPAYQKFVQMAFHQKRKTLRNNLKGQFSAEAIDESFNKLKLKPTARAEELEIDFWPEFYKTLTRG